MQGLFKLGIVGTREQMEDFLKKVPENELLAGWVLEEEPVEAGEGLRTVEGYGVKPFLDRCKLVVENDGSGNISSLEEMADEISRLVPELEVVLLTQYLDYDLDGSWNVYYSPAGTEDVVERTGTLCRGEPGEPVDLDGLMEWKDMGAPVSPDNPIFQVDLEDVLRYAAEQGYERDDGGDITREELEEFLNALQDEEAEADRECAAYYALSSYFSDRMEPAPYVLEGDSLPSLEYLARLFAGCWGLELNVSYRFRPTEFDGRFAGKTFVVTGNPDDYGRKGTEELIQKLGGVVRSAVSGKTDYLVAGEGAGSRKLEKARELGVKILDTDAFEAMVAQ